MKYDASLTEHLLQEMKQRNELNPPVSKESVFMTRDLSAFRSGKEAYHQFILDIALQQRASARLVMEDDQVKRIFVDGGFSKNIIYMNMLAMLFPQLEVFAASMAQATAIGTALAIHQSWNRKPIPNDIIELKYYATHMNMEL